ncbi:hypothetical protein Tco_0138448 [Tanacetum coccineum]
MLVQVMAAPIISISSDSSEESVGTVLAVSPSGVLDLVDYSSSSDFDPSEDSLPPVPDLQLFQSSERSLDSSSLSSGPSRKICRPPTTLVPSPTHVLRSIAPTPANLLPPRKRFRDSYSSKDSIEEHMEVD